MVGGKERSPLIVIRDKKDCCGCGACRNVCPQKCIRMEYDKEGFAYPQADSARCIECGLCEKACPILQWQPKQSELKQSAFVVQNKDATVHRQSTAGGAFTGIAEYVIDQGGVVFGVEMGKDHVVHHTCVRSKEELYRFRGSKYVQSDTQDTYSQVKENLEEGRLVCYSGTPCQIEGLRGYLRGKPYENLILVDVVCRAVPSPGIWKQYIGMEESRHGPVESVCFRDKALGYQYSTMVLKTKTEEFRDGIESQPWLRMFFSGMIIRPSCTACKFRTPSRNSDFTIWDCYNVYDFDRNLDDRVGTTRVLLHNDKARKIFDQIKTGFVYQEVAVQQAIRGVKEMQKSPECPPNRDAFFRMVKEAGVETALQRYFPITWKVRMKKYGRLALNKMGLDRMIKRLKNRQDSKN